MAEASVRQPPRRRSWKQLVTAVRVVATFLLGTFGFVLWARALSGGWFLRNGFGWVPLVAGTILMIVAVWSAISLEGEGDD